MPSNEYGGEDKFGGKKRKKTTYALSCVPSLAYEKTQLWLSLILTAVTCGVHVVFFFRCVFYVAHDKVYLCCVSSCWHTTNISSSGAKIFPCVGQ